MDILKEMGLVMGTLNRLFDVRIYLCITIISYISAAFLGLDKGECTEENLEIAKCIVPEVLKKYVERNYKVI